MFGPVWNLPGVLVRFELGETVNGELKPGYWQLLDIKTGAATTPPIDAGGAGGFGPVMPASREWAVNASYFPYSLQVVSLPDGKLIKSTPFGDTNVQLTLPDDGSVVLMFEQATGDSWRIVPGRWEPEPSGLAPGEAVQAQFSFDGRYLATADTRGKVVLRDGKTFAPIRSFGGDSGNSNTFNGGFAFTNDDRYLLTTVDKRGQLWEVATGQPIGGPFGSFLPESFPYGVPGDSLRYITATEKWIEISTFNFDSWPELACRAAGRNLTMAEWQQYGPSGEPYHATCAEWPSGLV
jgi:WD40 repeat protein